MAVADDSIATFAGVDSFISEVVYLLHKSFAVNSKDATLSGSQEVDGSRLGRHAWEVNLLCKIKAVMHAKVTRVGWSTL